MNELIIKQTPATISANFEDVKAGLENMMQAYNVEVTEDNIPERKKDVATLRKMKGAIEDKRKAVKKEYEEPLKEFEDKVKDLTKIIDGGIKHINDQLNTYELKRIAEKQEIINRVYADNIGEYEQFLPLKKVFDPRWNNKTCTEKEIASDIQQMRLAVEHDLTVLQGSCGDNYDDCLQVYKRDGNSLLSAMQSLNDLRAAADRVKQDLQKVAEEEKVKEPEKKIMTWTFRVHSKEDADSVRAYLNMFGMKYEEGTW